MGPTWWVLKLGLATWTYRHHGPRTTKASRIWRSPVGHAAEAQEPLCQTQINCWLRLGFSIIINAYKLWEFMLLQTATNGEMHCWVFFQQKHSKASAAVQELFFADKSRSVPFGLVQRTATKHELKCACTESKYERENKYPNLTLSSCLSSRSIKPESQKLPHWRPTHTSPADRADVGQRAPGMFLGQGQSYIELALYTCGLEIGYIKSVASALKMASFCQLNSPNQWTPMMPWDS